MPLSKNIKYGSLGFVQGVMMGMAIMAFVFPHLEWSDPHSPCGTQKNALVKHFNKQRDQVFPVIGAVFLILCVSALAILLSPTEKKRKRGRQITGHDASGTPAGAWRKADGSRHRQSRGSEAKVER